VAAVAINRVVDDVPTATVRSALGAPVETVPADPRVGRSVVEERPVVETASDSEAAAAFEWLANRAAPAEN
jgi:septum site-determining protein MinD